MPMLTDAGVFGGPVGTCRFNPPSDDRTWPIVREDDWCGRFEVSPRVKRRERVDVISDVVCRYRPPASTCVVCRYFSDADIPGHHPAIPA